MDYFYITTPLYYVNDKPHIGTSYSTVMADILKSYHQLLGYESFLMTGTDEHGQKCSQSAKKQGTSPQSYCDKMSKQFESTWKSLHISYDLFFRTTHPNHKQAVQKCLQELYDKNLIYQSIYEGWYSVREEIFYPKKDVKESDKKEKDFVKIKEKNYFFKMSQYQKTLIQYIQEHPDFIQPAHRKNEVLGFLKQPLEDLCISRPKNRLDWGIELPFDNDFVTYVWVDALLNYVTGVGYQQAKQSEKFQKWWMKAKVIHLIGKDILITHCVYWPCLLLALGLQLPKTILAHGWLLNQENKKMSKSSGDVMDPKQLLKIFDSDSIRYFLASSMSIGSDAPISHELIARRIGEDLSNNLGNLLRRTTKMIHQHFDSRIPERQENTKDQASRQLKNLAIETAESVKKDALDLRVHLASKKIIHLLTKTNQYMEQMAPWKLIKKNKKQSALVLRTALETLYLSAVLLKPFMPNKMAQLLDSLSCPDEWPVEHLKKGIFPKAGVLIQDIPPLFPKITLQTE